MLKKIFTSKKIVVSLVGLLVGLLAEIGLNLTPEAHDALVTLVIAVVGSYNVGQGLADGLSKGRTSAGRDIYD